MGRRVRKHPAAFGAVRHFPIPSETTLVQPAVYLPQQVRPRVRELTPELRLMLAVAERAILDRAYRWLHGQRGLYSVQNIAEVFGWDTDKLRDYWWSVMHQPVLVKRMRTVVFRCDGPMKAA